MEVYNKQSIHRMGQAGNSGQKCMKWPCFESQHQSGSLSGRNFHLKCPATSATGRAFASLTLCSCVWHRKAHENQMANAQRNNCEWLNTTQIEQYIAVLSTYSGWFQRYFLTSCETCTSLPCNESVTRCWPLHGCNSSSFAGCRWNPKYPQYPSPPCFHLPPHHKRLLAEHCNSATIRYHFACKNQGLLREHRSAKKCAGQQKNDNINIINTAVDSLQDQKGNQDMRS